MNITQIFHQSCNKCSSQEIFRDIQTVIAYFLPHGNTSFRLWILLHNGVDVSEVATFLVVVEAIAHDEVVRDFHHSVVDVEIHL